MWHCVTGWVVPYALKDCGAFQVHTQDFAFGEGLTRRLYIIRLILKIML
jgi:hypothetical protein